MSDKKKSDLKKRLGLLHEELKSIGPMMRGSVTVIGRKNKQPYFSVGINGKTKLIYLGNCRAETAQAYVDNYKRMLGIVNKMTVINMSLLKLMKSKQQP
jgi:hypothetical protein